MRFVEVCDCAEIRKEKASGLAYVFNRQSKLTGVSSSRCKSQQVTSFICWKFNLSFLLQNTTTNCQCFLIPRVKAVTYSAQSSAFALCVSINGTFDANSHWLVNKLAHKKCLWKIRTGIGGK